MALDAKRLLDWKFSDVRHAYRDKDTILYALSVGLGDDPVDSRQLKFVFEGNLEALPTMPIVLGMTDLGFLTDPAIGIDLPKMLHGESGLMIHAPVPSSGELISRMKLVDLVDKGPGKGALLYFERCLRDAIDDRPVATETGVFVLRGNGGFAAEPGRSRPPRKLPERAPDQVCDLATSPQAALLYRLNNDRNPLHADPEVARSAGFSRPILHGSCTYGIAGHAILRTVCGYDAMKLKRLDVRFTSPVFPGETLRIEMWREPGSVTTFRCRALERDAVVLDNGYAKCLP
jgi:acyl dehydratase